MPRRLVHLLLGLCAAWLVLFELHALGLPGVPTGPVKELHLVVMAVCAGLCLARAAAVPGETAAWTLIGLGLLSWIVGEAYFTFVLWDDASPPVPSPADVGFLLMPPFVFTGVALLLKDRVRGLSRTLWVDGVTSALAVGALCAAVVVEAVLDTVGGTRLAIVTNLSYPVADLILIGIIVGGVAASGWRVDRTFGFLIAGVVTFWLADSVYLVLVAKGTWSSGGPIDGGWWLTAVLFATAAWQPARARAAQQSRRTTVIAVPIGFAAISLGVLVAGSVVHLNLFAIVLATLSLIAVMVRLLLTFGEGVTVLDSSRREALTDALTGLGNRRALTADLEETLASEHSAVLVLFDLDGFKRYNDTFGHPAGDALLSRLGASLDLALGTHGRAYRMGGDEFCALVPFADELLLADWAAALSERGDGFEITSSCGAVRLPEETGEASEALRIADQRLYVDKRSSRGDAPEEAVAVMLRIIADRDPDLRTHGADVADLAGRVAALMGLSDEEIERVRHAAELHDVGKIAIPDEILSKQGPLDEREWAFIRRHPLVGERIVRSSPGFGPVAAIVRTSQERWDGSGYPDGLAGERIPLAARIVGVCDAFDAMTKNRPYRSGMAELRALVEVKAAAGTSFDPRVVAAFAEALDARDAARGRRSDADQTFAGQPARGSGSGVSAASSRSR